MPRRKNQNTRSTTPGGEAAETSHSSDVESTWRDTTLRELQSMFSVSLDPEVVQLVLSESNYNVDDAIEKLFVLTGTEPEKKQDQISQESRPSSISPQVSNLDKFTSSSPGFEKEKSTHPVQINSPKASSYGMDTHFTETSNGTSVAQNYPVVSLPMKAESSTTFSPLFPSFGNSAAYTKHGAAHSDQNTGSVISDVHAGTRNQYSNLEVPSTQCHSQNPVMSTSTLFSPHGVSNNGSSQGLRLNAPSGFCYNNTNPMMLSGSSGLPEFPDNISQQYKDLNKQNKTPVGGEKIVSQERPNNGCPMNITKGTSTNHNSFGFSGAGVPLETKQEHHSLENFLKTMAAANGSVSEDWKKSGHTGSEQQMLDWESGRKRLHSPSTCTSVANTSDTKRQLRYNERTSSHHLPSNSKNTSYTSPSQNGLNTFPVHDLSRANWPTREGNPSSLSHQNIYPPPRNFQSNEPVFHPPFVQRQFQPAMQQSRGFSMPDPATQLRWRQGPTLPPSWQQGPNMVPWCRPVGLGPHRYPQGTSSQQPHLQFGRGATRQPVNSPPVKVPFISTVHQRLLILMRGLPGSGKSTLAQKLKGAKGVVLSTDDYFMKNQRYEFDGSLLGEAHEWNQKRAKRALESQISPIIIDNTNTQTWEMKPYVSMALKNGYHVKFIEPDVSWKWNVKELARRNHHEVHMNSIMRMKERYDHDVTADKVMSSERKAVSTANGRDCETSKGTGSDSTQTGQKGLESRQVQIQANSKEKMAPGRTEVETATSTTSPASRQRTEERGLNVHKETRGADRNNLNKKTLNDSLQAKRTQAEEKSVLEVEDEQDTSPKPQRVRKTRDKRSPDIQQGLKEEDERTAEHGRLTLETDSVCSVESGVECSEVLSLPSSCGSPEMSPVCHNKASRDSHVTEACQSAVHCVDSTCSLGSETESEEAITCESDEKENAEERSLKTATSEFSEEALSEGSGIRDVEVSPCLEEETFCVSSSAVENDVEKVVLDFGHSMATHKDPTENCYISEGKSAPPPLSLILASAAKTKRRLASFNGNQKHPSTATEAEEHSDHSTTVSEAREHTENSTKASLEAREHTEDSATSKEVEEQSGESPATATFEAEECRDYPATATESDIEERREPPTTFTGAEEVSDRSATATCTLVSEVRRENPAIATLEVARHSEYPPTATEAEEHSEELHYEQSKPERGSELEDTSTQKAKNGTTKKENLPGDIESNMSGLEFLRTCFPDVDRDHVNILLAINNGNVMKVVDDLLSSRDHLNATPPSPGEVSTHVQQSSAAGDTLLFPTLEGANFAFLPQATLVGGEVGSSHAALGIVSTAHERDKQREKEKRDVSSSQQREPKESTHDRQNLPRDLETSASLPRPHSHTVSDMSTFQLALEPAVALHLIEMFGSFSGLNLEEDINHEDLIVDVDHSFARQLYKKWEKTLQARKGISVSKTAGSSNVGSSRSRRLVTDHQSLDVSRGEVQSDARKRSPRRSIEPQTGTLREIMDEQLALELSRNDNMPDASEQDMATTLKKQRLYEMFPGVDPQALDAVFQVNRHELEPTVEAVKASCNLSGQQIPNNVVFPGYSGQFPNRDDVINQETEEDWSWLDSFVPSQQTPVEDSFQALQAPEYSDYRAEAVQHAKQRDECFKKAALAFSKKQGQLAQFYAQQGHLHTEKIKEANSRAAALILDRKNENMDGNTIDLHGLHVSEAIEALESLLIEKTDPLGSQSRRGCKFISVVTGRGSHSRGGKARIKPAVLEYLKKNNYRYTEPHPGLVKVLL